MYERTMILVQRTLAVLIACLMLPAGVDARVVFWIEPGTNSVLDQQVAKIVASRADLVVLRAKWNDPDPAYTLPSIVQRFKKAGSMPVLSYAWALRYRQNGRSEADLLRGLDVGQPLAESGEEGGKVTFLDVNDAALRRRVVERFVAARRKLGVDGFAIDLSVRTPKERPAVLARRCKSVATYCDQYAEGVDALFAELRQAVGNDAVVVYNGLFNFAPWQIADQERLLKNTNGAAIEYFGLDPNESAHSYTRDILPFLNALPSAAPDRSVLFFGRGLWQYSDYLEDYRWQRYLYASYLLGARQTDYFKYHATFQEPTLKGRTGGLAYFADWGVDLGEPRGSAVTADGLIRREYSNGLVVVAPDDGRGGSLTLPHPYFTSEGRRVEGSITLEPGTGMLLTDKPDARVERPATRRIDAAEIGSWGWPQSSYDSGKRVLRLEQPPDERDVGEHDVLLDWERTLRPYRQLVVEANELPPQSSILAVAEVDDRRRASSYVVVEVSARGAASEPRPGSPVLFRSPTPKRGGDEWPTVGVASPRGAGPIELDGPALLKGTGYRFIRWSHVRFVGPSAVTSITLADPYGTLKVGGER